MTLSATSDDRELALAPLDEKADHVRGSPVGRLIIEYGDYECPYSRQAFHAIELVGQKLGGNMRFAFRHFPLTHIHPHALAAAAAAEAAARQGRFWDMHELLFHRQKEDCGKAFGSYGAIAAAGGAVGLLLGGALTEYLSWRWTLYVNLLFAGVAFTGGALLLKRQPSRVKARLDVPGALLVSSAVFCLVYGLSNAATHHWRTPSTYGFLAAGVVLLVVFALWQGRAARPLLPPWVELDRNRGGSVGTSLLNTIFAGAVASYVTAHLAAARIIGRHALTGLVPAHGYDTAFWWTASIFAGGAVIAGALLRRGPLVPTGTPSRAQAEVPTAQAKTGPDLVTAPRANRLIDLRAFLIHCPVLASARSWVICAATIMVDGCTGVRSASIWRTQSQALPRCPSVASMVDE